jgi:hypothetical protein
MYCNPPGQQSIYVYRITQVNEDGYAVELSWNQMAARCRELGVPTVPFISQFVYEDDPGDCQTGQDYLKCLVEHAACGPSIIDPSHMREGVVIRVEAPDGTTEWYKHKNFEFKVMEGIVKDNDAIVDIEEAS